MGDPVDHRPRGILTALRERKLVQWAVAYVAAVFALLQGIDIVAQKFGWPDSIERILILAACIGFFLVLILAWYHGERGAQKVSGTELAILTLLLAIGGGFLWRFAATVPAPVAAPPTPVAGVPAATPLTPPPAAPDKSIAVLPFENLSEDKANEYFASGMQDLILTKLADIGDLKVISRTSTLSYGSHPQNLKIVGQQLGVATLLEGSVQKAGDQVLINVQLIDARTDNHLWAQSYTRTLKDVFSVEGDVAEQIATALNAKLSPAESARLATALSDNPAANDLFLRAEHVNNFSGENPNPAWWKQAISLYRQAIAKAPDFALARANLSILESNLVWRGPAGEDVQRLNADARTQAERALELAPDLADTHLAMGFNDYWGHRHYAAALVSFAAALRLRPNDAEALAARGFVFKHQGKFDAASASLQEAFTQNPRSSHLANELGLSYMVVSRYAEAKTALQQALALDPHNITAKYLYSEAILFANGDLEGAMAAAQGASPSLQSWRIDLLVFQRKYHAALNQLDAMPDVFGDKARLQAHLYQLTGETSKARPLFAEALSAAQAQLKSATADPTRRSMAFIDVAAAEMGLGHAAAALAALAQSQAQMALVDDYVVVPWLMVLNALHYAAAGRADLAVPLLAKAMASPGNGSHYSPVMLWIDPAWDPIRKGPGFQALLKKYADAAPATASSEVNP